MITNIKMEDKLIDNNWSQIVTWDSNGSYNTVQFLLKHNEGAKFVAELVKLQNQPTIIREINYGRRG